MSVYDNLCDSCRGIVDAACDAHPLRDFTHIITWVEGLGWVMLAMDVADMIAKKDERISELEAKSREHPATPT